MGGDLESKTGWSQETSVIVKVNTYLVQIDCQRHTIVYSESVCSFRNAILANALKMERLKLSSYRQQRNSFGIDQWNLNRKSPLHGLK